MRRGGLHLQDESCCRQIDNFEVGGFRCFSVQIRATRASTPGQNAWMEVLKLGKTSLKVFFLLFSDIMTIRIKQCN